MKRQATKSPSAKAPPAKAPKAAAKPLAGKPGRPPATGRQAAAAAARREAEEQEAAAALAAKKQAEAAKKKAAEEAAVARKKAAEEAARKAAEEAAKKKAAEEAARKKADEPIARKEAEEAVAAARRHAEAEEAAAAERALEEERARQAAEEAAAAQRIAEEATVAARLIAEEAATAAKKAADEAAEAQRIAEEAARKAEAARQTAQEEQEAVDRQASSERAAKQLTEEEAARLASRKKAGEEALRSRKKDEALSLEKLRTFCDRLDLTAEADIAKTMETLEKYIAQKNEEETAWKRADEVIDQVKLPEKETFNHARPSEQEVDEKPQITGTKVPEQIEGAAEDGACRSEAQEPGGEQPARPPLLRFYEISAGHGAAKWRGSPEDLAGGKATYEGRATYRTALERVDDITYKSKLGIEHGLFRVIDDRKGFSVVSTPVFLSLREVAVNTAAQPVAIAEPALAPAWQEQAAAPRQTPSADLPGFSPPQNGDAVEQTTQRRSPRLALRGVSADSCAPPFQKEVEHSAPLPQPSPPPPLPPQESAPADPVPMAVEQAEQTTHRRSPRLSSRGVGAGSCAPSFQKEVEHAAPLPQPLLSPPQEITPAEPVPAVQALEAAPSASAAAESGPAGASASASVSGSSSSGSKPFAETAKPRHKELISTLASRREMLQAKSTEVQVAEAAKVSASVRIRAVDEAEAPRAKRLEDALTVAQRTQETCANAASTVTTMFDRFKAFREAPSEKAKASANDLKAHLKLMGVKKDVVEAVPQLLAKKKPSKRDKDMLGTVEDAFEQHKRIKMNTLTESNIERRRREDAVKMNRAATQARAAELSRFDEALKLRHAERKLCEDAVNFSERELEDHERRMTREGLMRFSSTGQSCAVCCDDLPAESAVLLGCGHGWYCAQCITRFVEARLEAGSAGDTPCPECKAPISEGDLVNLLPTNVIFRLYTRSEEQRAVASGAIPRACPTPNCPMRQTFAKSSTDGRLTCLLCSKESCWLCGTQPYHEGETCEQHAKKRRAERQDEESLFQWMQATGTKQCPTCGMATTKQNLEKQNQQYAECHKMMCRVCGTRFCFKCLAILTDTYACRCTDKRHEFVDPVTGEHHKHLRRGKAKAKAKGQALADVASAGN